MDARLSPENRLVASCCDKSVRLWDFVSQKEFLQYKDTSFYNKELCFHPDGSYLAVGGYSQHLKIWDTRSHRLMQDYVVGKNINSIDFHPSGNYLACATNSDNTKDDSVVHIYDIRQVRPLFHIKNVNSNMTSIRFSQKTGDQFVSGDSEGLTYVWNTNFYDYEQNKREEEIEQKKQSSNIYKGDNQVEFGTAININNNVEYNNSSGYVNNQQNRAMEELSLKLEGFVGQINGISQEILRMESRISKNENNTKKLLNFLENNNRETNQIPDLQENMNSNKKLNLPFDSMVNSKYCSEQGNNFTLEKTKFEDTFGASKFSQGSYIPQINDNQTLGLNSSIDKRVLEENYHSPQFEHNVVNQVAHNQENIYQSRMMQTTVNRNIDYSQNLGQSVNSNIVVTNMNSLNSHNVEMSNPFKNGALMNNSVEVKREVQPQSSERQSVEKCEVQPDVVNEQIEDKLNNSYSEESQH